MSSQKSRKHFLGGLDFFPSLLRYGRQLVQRLPLALSEAAITTLDRETMVMIYSMITLGVYYKIPPVFLNIQSFFLFFFLLGLGFFVVASIQIPSSFFPLAECASASPPGDTKVEQYNIPLVLRGPFKRQSKKKGGLGKRVKLADCN